MSSSFNRIKKNIIEAMQSTNNQGTSAYDSVAEVRRVDGDTAWVHIAGGVDETPVKLTIAAKAGDVVQVRVGGGRAWITGNASAPPTDDKTAIAAKGLANIAGNRANTAKAKADTAQTAADSAATAAANAAKTASNYITDETNGIFVHPQSNTTDGVKITSTVDIIKSGVVLASYGDGITLGDSTQAGYMQIKNGQISIRFHNTALNETGWIDFGTGSDGTNVLNIYENVGSVLSTILNLDLYGNATFGGDVESAGNVLSSGNITAGGAVFANNFKCGTVTITPTAAGAVTSKTIYFDKSFRSAPVVVCNPVSTRPDICMCTPYSISQNSFELNFYRTSKTATRINWFAFATS